MVKQTQTIRWLLPTNFLSVFDHFVGLALKGFKNTFCHFIPKSSVQHFLGKSSAPISNIYDAATSYKETWKVPCIDFS